MVTKKIHLKGADEALRLGASKLRDSVRSTKAIATTGTNGLATACVTCHGPKLAGAGLVPPLAGRYPTYIVRQLIAFKTGTRSTPASQPMQAVVARLSVDEMIAVAAYAASLAPHHSR